MTLPNPVFDGVIDVSHNNGAIDWSAVAGAGIALAFVKASEGTGFVDPLYASNRAGAAAAGLIVVPYHFLDAGADPAAQATHFIVTARLTAGSPAMLDWETTLSDADFLAFGSAVEAAIGRDPVAYYGAYQPKDPSLGYATWPLMLPEYPRGSTPGDYASLVRAAPEVPPGRPAARPYDFHQYTPAGQIPGIAGPVDRSIWVGTLDQLKAWHATGALPA